MTWYSSEKELCGIKDYNIIRTRSTYLYYDGVPLFPFGHGLSYTVFRYERVGIPRDQKQRRIFIEGQGGIKQFYLLFGHAQVLSVAALACVYHRIVAAEYHRLVSIRYHTSYTETARYRCVQR